jgi:uncharacterized protein DUF3800
LTYPILAVEYGGKTAAVQLWRLVSGFPPGKRERRYFMVLFPQAAIDDSGSEPQSPVFILAGFAAPFGAWLNLSGEWQALLDKEPKLDYFKMSEAASLSEQFHPQRGWNERLRDARVLDLANVAAKFAIVRIHTSIKNEHFTKYITSLPMPERKLGNDSPYVLMFMQIILAMATGGTELGMQGACDFIFDEQGAFGREALDWWPNFKQLVNTQRRSDIAKFVGDRPIFRNEQEFLPLQASDLYAWHIRRHAERSQHGLIIPAPPVLRKFDKMAAIGRNYGEAELQRLRAHLVKGGEIFAANNPHIPLHLPGKTKAERKRLRKKTKGALSRASWSRKPA